MAKYLSVVFIVSILCSYACSDKNIDYFELRNIKNSTWTYDKGLSFTIAISDTTQFYDFNIWLDHIPSFGYENLYLDIETTFPSGQVKSDVISLELADHYGNWIGKCTSTSCSTPFQLNHNMRFSSPGNHTFVVHQHSRKDSLRGIVAMGIELKKIKAN